MSFLSGADWTGGGSSKPASRAERVAIGLDRVAVTEALTCRFCTPHGPVREFLSRAVRTRPIRVKVGLRVCSVG